VRELQESGDVASVPHTQLTHEPTDIADPA